jgi:cell division protein FtsB
MATRSRPARRTTTRKATTRRKTQSQPKRRPSARRKPAARRGGSRIHWDRVGRVALTLVLAAVLYSYLNPAIDFVKTYTATTAAKAEFHEKLRENKRLHKRIQTADDPIVISRKARAQGMVAEGETPIVVSGLGG